MPSEKLVDAFEFEVTEWILPTTLGRHILSLNTAEERVSITLLIGPEELLEVIVVEAQAFLIVAATGCHHLCKEAALLQLGLARLRVTVSQLIKQLFLWDPRRLPTHPINHGYSKVEIFEHRMLLHVVKADTHLRISNKYLVE